MLPKVTVVGRVPVVNWPVSVMSRFTVRGRPVPSLDSVRVMASPSMTRRLPAPRFTAGTRVSRTVVVAEDGYALRYVEGSSMVTGFST